jgi:hypothetical protein
VPVVIALAINSSSETSFCKYPFLNLALLSQVYLGLVDINFTTQRL